MTAFLGDCRGSTAIEYALVASLIAMVIVAVVGNIGTEVLNLYSRIHF